ncbi:MAG TPA: hypothetical protein VGD77_16510 [Gemmatimonadaceae bacterium]
MTSFTRRPRRGIALITALLMLSVMAALALASIYLGSNAGLAARAAEHERDLRYAADEALAIGRSRLDRVPATLPDTGYRTVLASAALNDASGQPIRGLEASVYVGPSGIGTGQYGRFASIVSEAHDASGARFVRRLELTQESFAKFAYWSNRESNSGSTIYFGNDDELWGPVWSNDQISIASSRATFHDEVGTASTISGVSYGSFSKGYKIRQPRIDLPSNSRLARLAGYASAAGLSFNAPTSGSETSVRMRIEFLTVDLNGNGDSTEATEAFIRVYTANAGNMWALRGDWPTGGQPNDLCGDWHAIGGEQRFFPVSVHNTAWFETLLRANGYSNAAAATHRAASTTTILSGQGARCLLAGDPRLASSERLPANYPVAADRQSGGTDRTFTPVGKYGAWRQFTATPSAALAARRPWDAGYLYPLSRANNINAKGVIHVNGTVGVSGWVAGGVTLYAENGTIVVLDDLRYMTDPALTGPGRCHDILGLIAGKDVVVADNAINTPQQPSGSGSYRVLDETKDLFVHGVMMAITTSFRVENFADAPRNATSCEGATNGRGCLYLTGGVIQEARGAVGLLSGEGYVKRYSYDRCAAEKPPPYFPTTGRFQDNGFYELDPTNFDIAALFRRIAPAP